MNCSAESIIEMISDALSDDEKKTLSRIIDELGTCLGLAYLARRGLKCAPQNNPMSILLNQVLTKMMSQIQSGGAEMVLERRDDVAPEVILVNSRSNRHAESDNTEASHQ